MKRHLSDFAEVRATLQRIVDGTAGAYELDDCFSVKFSDSRLESIRLRLWRLPDEFPPESKGNFCGQAGMDVMRGWIQDLSDENAA
jgi:hypothetical protein